VAAGDVYKFAIAVLIFEDFAGRVLKKTSDDPGYVAVLELSLLLYSRFSGEVEFDDILFYLNVLLP
jgi:hypothetical protein